MRCSRRRHRNARPLSVLPVRKGLAAAAAHPPASGCPAKRLPLPGINEDPTTREIVKNNQLTIKMIVLNWAGQATERKEIWL